MEAMVKADLVKPNYDRVKKIWAQLLSQYYDDCGNLKEEFLTPVACPFCANEKKHSPFVINGFKHVTCAECATVYVTPRLKEKCLERLYNDDYYSTIYAESMIPIFETRKNLIGKNKFKQVSKFVKYPGRVLDIGCGVGEVIDVFSENKWDCTAIEVNPVAIKWLKERGIRVFNQPFNEFPSEHMFDVIMAWGVVEHVVDPDVFLKKVYQLLKPGGVFVSEVPNGESMTVDYCRSTGKDPGRIIMGEQHITLYSVSAYEKLHEEIGFSKLLVQTNGLDVETILKGCGTSVPDEVLFNMQECINQYMKGDLLRGFWTRVK